MNSGSLSWHLTSPRRWLAAILLISLCLNTVGLRWGLPNGNATWAADSFRPLVPLALTKRALWEEHWNSGWFTKYPLGHPFLLMGAQLPYVLWLRATGQFHSASKTYPYGFRDPERALSVLMLIGRAVSVLMGVGLVALAYVIGATLFGTPAGLAAAILVSGCYPIVFYAHTTNVDIPMLFWIAVAIAAALRCADRDSPAAAVMSGIATAMALFTKEQSIGAVAMVPVIWFIRRGARAGLDWQLVVRYLLASGSGLVITTIPAGNVWRNPMGFINRWRFLAGILPAYIRDKYMPYQSQLQVPNFVSLSAEIQRFLKVLSTVATAMTIPLFALGLVGAAWALARRPRAAAIMFALIASYYLLSTRATALLPVRYTMPLMFFILVLGGAPVGALLESMAHWPSWALRQATAGILTVGAVAALLPGVELDRLLIKDPRYAAETWLLKNVPADAHVETYQHLTYLPRFGPNAKVTEVPLAGRTVEQFRERQPDFIVLSSGGRAGLTGRYLRDWQPGKPVVVDSRPAKEFFDQLRSERLGYRPVGRFYTPTHCITPRINSLDPEITIFARDRASVMR